MLKPFSFVQDCNLSIREDLLNQYVEDTVDYCTAASNSSVQDALASSLYLVKEKERQILQLQNTLDALCSELSAYKEKHSHDTPKDKRHAEKKCKYRKYFALFWFMIFVYVARILIPTI